MLSGITFLLQHLDRLMNFTRARIIINPGSILPFRVVRFVFLDPYPLLLMAIMIIMT